MTPGQLGRAFQLPQRGWCETPNPYPEAVFLPGNLPREQAEAQNIDLNGVIHVVRNWMDL